MVGGGVYPSLPPPSPIHGLGIHHHHQSVNPSIRQSINHEHRHASVVPVHVALSETDDAPGADRDAGLSHALDRVEPIFVLSGRGDLLVVLWRRVQVVVVGGETLTRCCSGVAGE